MQTKDIKAKIKSGNLGGCYIFSGEEDYLKKHYLSELRAAVITDEAFAPFNHSVYDGADIDFAAITDDIHSPPMMADFKLIEWKYPSFEKMDEGSLRALEDVLDLLEEYGNVALAFLVADGEIDLGTEKKPSKFVKRFSERINIFNYSKSTDTQLLSWLKKHFDSNCIGVNADTLRALLFRSGHSMTVLAEEVTKLCNYAKARGKDAITPEDVTAVASSTPECDTYALSNALLERNKKAALFALDEMKGRRINPLIITGMMAKTYSELTTVCMMLGDGMGASAIESATRMNKYKLQHYISASKRFSPEKAKNLLEELTRVDTGAKFGGVTGYTAIELFIAKCV